VTKEDILKLMEIKMGRILKFNSDKADELIARMKEDIADRVEVTQFGTTREVLAVFVLQHLIPVDGIVDDVLYVNVFKKNDKRTIYNVTYRDGKEGTTYIKRFAVTDSVLKSP